MWLLILYGVLFWTFAVTTIILHSSREGDLAFASERIRQLPKMLVIEIKAIPALLGASFVLLLRPSLAFFYILLAVALIFCMLGDIGLEYNLLAGLGLFLVAQLIFTGTFLWQSTFNGLTFPPITAFITWFIAMLIYIIFYHQYLQSSEKGLGKMRTPILFYAFIVSLTSSSSILLWLTSGALLGFIPFIGAFFFVISDSLIGIREFHHHFQKAELITLTTYFLAIFLLSLSVAIYNF